MGRKEGLNYLILIDCGEVLMTSKIEQRSFEEWMIETLQDKEEAQGYLKVVLEEYLKDRDMVSLLNSLRILAIAKGGVLRLTEGPEPDQ